LAASSDADPVSLIPLPAERRDDAARMLARAFACNPLHIAMFGRHVLVRNEAFFAQRLVSSAGPWWAAIRGGSVAGVIHWLTEDDADPPRVTLGPLGVAPEAQRCGIGTRLMGQFCAAVDADKRAGYLETDQVANIDFYRRFEFDVVGEIPVGGVVQYVMWRPALL
jgi:ribosomal protein S18 acetylase RimI-like enzyme